MFSKYFLLQFCIIFQTMQGQWVRHPYEAPL